MMSAKMAAPSLLKITVFWNKGYGIIIRVDDVIDKILSRDLNYIVDVFMWPKFGNSSISMTEVVTTSILQGFDQNSCFFEGWSWFKFNNLGLIWYKLEITGEKLVGGLFAPPSWKGLKQNYLSRYFFRGNFFSQVLSAKVKKFLPVKIISIDVLFYRRIRQLKDIPKVTTFLIILWTKIFETIIIHFHSIDQ